jgi:hypothetical protein
MKERLLMRTRLEALENMKGIFEHFEIKGSN